jgi:hypothetical protein
MSVDYELEPDVSWSKIQTAIKSGKIQGVKILKEKDEPWKNDNKAYLLNKGKIYTYAFNTGAGVLFKEFGSRWSSTNPILDAIAKYFKVKYYADIDEDEWNKHVDRTSGKQKPAKVQHTPSHKLTPVNFSLKSVVPSSSKIRTGTSKNELFSAISSGSLWRK